MPLTSEFEEILKSQGFNFNQRAIAREIQSILQQKEPAGEVVIDESWDKNWDIDNAHIWAVIDLMKKSGYWEVIPEMFGNKIVCMAARKSSKVMKRKISEKRIGSIKRESEEYRVASMTLSDVSINQKMLMQEVSGSVDLSERFNLIKNPYAGWLPSDKFAAAGHVFKPDEGILNTISEALPDICIDLIMAMMYEDLRGNPKSRPSIQAFPYWIKGWVKRNSEKMKATAAAEDHSDNLTSLLDNY